MLRELKNVRQIPGERSRRWFTSRTMDLIIWSDPHSSSPAGLQLCYDKERAEKALTWRAGSGYAHTVVDDGENDLTNRHKATPVMLSGCVFDTHRVVNLFIENSTNLPPDIVHFVAEKIQAFAHEIPAAHTATGL